MGLFIDNNSEICSIEHHYFLESLMKIFTPLLTLIICSLGLNPVGAGTIFSFNFQAKNDTVTSESTSGSFGTLVDSNVQDVVVSLGDLTKDTAYSNAFGMSPKGTAATTIGDAITNNLYHTFTVTPVSGQQVTYETLNFNYTIQNGGTMEIYSSVDSFATPLYSNNSIGTGGAGTSDSLDLSSLGTQSSAVEFRFYAASVGNYDQRGIGVAFSTGNVSDDLVLTGITTAVPEPGTLTLLGIALGSLVFFRRRR